MMRWWWFGPAVTNQELEAEMRMMEYMGVGGFEAHFVHCPGLKVLAPSVASDERWRQ